MGAPQDFTEDGERPTHTKSFSFDLSQTSEVDEPGTTCSARLCSWLRQKWPVLLHAAVEAVIIVGFLQAVEYVRDLLGSNRVRPSLALHNAESIANIEKTLHIYWEESIQGYFLQYLPAIKLFNHFYRIVNQAEMGSAFLLLFAFFPARFQTARSALFVLFGIATCVYFLFPMMPPRMMPACDVTPGQLSTLGGCRPEYKYVDTLQEVGFWGWPKPRQLAATEGHHHSNRYAAMPSMHFGTSFWFAYALWPVLTRWWQRVVIGAFPAAVLCTIIITGNHFFLDALFGGIAVALAFFVAGFLPTCGLRLRAASDEEPDKASKQEGNMQFTDCRYSQIV